MAVETIVRPAKLEDAEAFASAYERSWDASIASLVGSRLGELAPLEARLDAYRASLEQLPEDAGLLVAERAGEVVGVAVHAASELRALYVVPEAWGTDAAPALAAAAIEGIRHGGHDQAFLWVGEQNARARRFYEREGWTADGDRREEPNFGLAEVRYGRGLT